ncbi:MAG TPA: DUF5682 family protein [Micromonosporaceae bacterium]
MTAHDEVRSPVLLGIRHHGPGSARAVRRVLDAYRPEVVLIEGPPEADDLVDLAGVREMRPPVALLAYPADRGGTPVLAGQGGVARPPAARAAAFWPFAEFSPEWQAVRWAVDHGVPVRFCDLPAAHRLAIPDPHEHPDQDRHPDPDMPRVDPIGALARAAGYDDPERWWEDVIEHRLGEAVGEGDELTAALAPFVAIGEAMAAVRAHAPVPGEAERIDEERREAYMRTVLRAAVKRYTRVAVVCGAWHVPALTARRTATEDARVLRGLPKVKTMMTWVPWSHGRLASWQGYGAGVSSPGWYHHLFTVPDRPVIRWFVDVAGVLRDEGLPVSSAHVIEAVRLAEALATMRCRPLAGLAEVREATRAVLCDGDELRMSLVDRRLVVGERLGTVPDDIPAAPLVRDVTATRRRLRLAPSALDSGLDLDLRKDVDRQRSHLLHRLRLLGVDWGSPASDAAARRGRGTFWESWRLCWRPEFAVDLVEASAYGTTVVAAATAKTRELARRADRLGEVTSLLERCLLADLADALPDVLRALNEKIALDADVTDLMAAMPALARSLRYGDVRGTDVSALGEVVAGLVVRVCVGLPTAVAGLDEAAAREVVGQIDAVHGALALVDDAELTGRWFATLGRLVGRTDLPGVVSGRITRLLLDAGRLDRSAVVRRMSVTLSVGTPPGEAATWVEGFLAGSGLLLVHDERLLSLVDEWVTGIRPDLFVEVLPLLRRTFATFPEPERRAIGERVRSAGYGRASRADVDLDERRAARVLPTVALLLGRDTRDVEALVR